MPEIYPHRPDSGHGPEEPASDFSQDQMHSGQKSIGGKPRLHPGLAFLAGGILVAGAFAIFYFANNKPGTPAALPTPQPTEAIIVANPDDEIIYHAKPTDKAMYIRSKGSNVRQDPSLKAPILISLEQNIEVMDTGTRQQADGVNWAYVRLPDNRQGWISAQLLTQDPVSILPSPSPTPQAQATAPTAAVPSPAVSIATAPPAASLTAREATVRNRAMQWKYAWESRNLDSAEMIMHNGFRGQGMTKAAWLKQRRIEAARTRSRRIVWEDVRTNVAEQTAEVSAIQHYHDTFQNGQTYDSSVRVQLSFVRWSDGNWYLMSLRYRPV